MATILNENFDGVTAPALPDDVLFYQTGGSSFVTSTSFFLSSPNSLAVTVPAGGGSVSAMSLYPDSGNGNITVTVSVYAPAGSPGFFGGSRISVGNQAGWETSGDNSYVLANFSGANGFFLLRYNSGVQSTLVNIAGSLFATGIWYTISLTRNGSNFTGTVQRSSDSNWLTSGGAWQLGAATAITYTDTSPLPAVNSFGGLFLWQPSTGTFYGDNLTVAGTAVLTNYPLTDPGNSTGWTLVPGMSDEFNGSGLDTTKWNSPPLFNNPPASWVPADPGSFPTNFVVESGGTLQFPCTWNSGTVNCGAIQSKATISYAYFECRCKMTHAAMDNGFWLDGPLQHAGQSNTWTEIDIVEITAIAGSGATLAANTDAMTAHLWQYPGHLSIFPTDYINQSGTNALGVDCSVNYHVYGLSWTPTTITWYFDGVQKYQVTAANTLGGQPIPSYFIANMNVLWSTNPANSFTGVPVSGSFPTTAYVDYIRTWSYSGTIFSSGSGNFRRRRR